MQPLLIVLGLTALLSADKTFDDSDLHPQAAGKSCFTTGVSLVNITEVLRDWLI